MRHLLAHTSDTTTADSSLVFVEAMSQERNGFPKVVEDSSPPLAEYAIQCAKDQGKSKGKLMLWYRIDRAQDRGKNTWVHFSLRLEQLPHIYPPWVLYEL
jgi:hypothetical protein